MQIIMVLWHLSSLACDSFSVVDKFYVRCKLLTHGCPLSTIVCFRWLEASDVNKDFSHKDQYQVKDFTVKDKDKD